MLQQHLEGSIERLLLAKQGLTSLKSVPSHIGGLQATQWQYNGYLVWEIPDALASEECDALVAAQDTGAMKPLLKLLGRFSGVPESHNDAPQLIHTKEGKKHKYEFDWCKAGTPGCEAGPRDGMLLVWLNDAHGADIEFPSIGLEVEPKKGKALFFFATDDRGTPFMESMWEQKASNPGADCWLAMACTRHKPVVAPAVAEVPAPTTSIEEARPANEPDTQVQHDNSTPEDMS